MTPPVAQVVDGALIAALICASYTDLRWRRIKNWLTYPAMVAGFAVNTLAGGGEGARLSAMGWLVGLGIMALPFVFGVMGAGDVKLMAAIGAIKGAHFLLLVTIYGSAAGGLLAVYYLIRERRLGATLRYITYGWYGALRGNGPKPGAIPYAPAIAAGVILALLPYSFITLS
jgi:prepilin peptidase CpaA